MLAEYDVAVVIAGYTMPEMDGSEFLKKVGKLYPSVIRIMISGNCDKESVVRAFNEDEIFPFLEKTVSEAVLRNTLHQAFLRLEYELSFGASQATYFVRLSFLARRVGALPGIWKPDGIARRHGLSVS